VVREHGRYVAAEVLASEVTVGGDIGDSPNAVQTVELDGSTVRIALTRVR
jgi:hypothetical protein